jgi:hypothetical protein
VTTVPVPTGAVARCGGGGGGGAPWLDEDELLERDDVELLVLVVRVVDAAALDWVPATDWLPSGVVPGAGVADASGPWPAWCAVVVIATVVCAALVAAGLMCATAPVMATAAKAGTATHRLFTRGLFTVRLLTVRFLARLLHLSQITATPLRSGRPPRENVCLAPARDRPGPPP